MAERIPEPYSREIADAYREEQLNRAYISKPFDFLKIDQIKQKIKRHFDFSGPFKKIIDIGCGIGSYTSIIAEIFEDAEIIGIDIDKNMIDLAKSHFEENNPKLKYIEGSVYDLKKFYDQADLIICTNSLHHFDRLDDAISEMYKALKENRFLYVRDLNRENIKEAIGLRNYLNISTQLEIRGKDNFLDVLKMIKFSEEDKNSNLISIISWFAAYDYLKVAKAIRPKFQGSLYEIGGEHDFEGIFMRKNNID